MPMPQIPTPDKRCVMCGKRMVRTRFNGRLMDRAVFIKQKFCSLTCANSRDKGGISHGAFRRRARKHLKKECECCGDSRYLHAHHIDNDWTNNTPENIQTLCIFCHQFWHATLMRRGNKPASVRMPDMRHLFQ